MTCVDLVAAGYGDYYPTTVLGKFLTIAMILFSLAIVSDQVSVPTQPESHSLPSHFLVHRNPCGSSVPPAKIKVF